eukprot:30937-Pelagococcus_subviridis.AAC.11
MSARDEHVYADVRGPSNVRPTLKRFDPALLNHAFAQCLELFRDRTFEFQPRVNGYEFIHLRVHVILDVVQLDDELEGRQQHGVRFRERRQQRLAPTRVARVDAERSERRFAVESVPRPRLERAPSPSL